MKLLKTLAVGALALACVGSSYATTVKVTGSSAFRKALYAAIINQLGGSGVCKVAYTGATSLGSANQAIFTNGTDTVQACMAGSVGGVNWIVNDSLVATVAPFDPTYAAKTATAWIAPSNVTGSTAVATIGAAPSYALSGGTQLSTVTWEAASKADFCMSDSLQDSTPFDSGSTGVTLTQAAGTDLGVVQFLFAKGQQNSNIPAASYNAFTNMTALGFRNLSSTGIAKLSAFTGIASDAAYSVVLVGRDSDSGTRLATTKETGLGGVDSPMVQFRAFNSSSQDIGSVSTAAQAIASLASAGGTQAGYSSGGHVKRVLDSTVNSTAQLNSKYFVVVAYVGTGDAPAAAAQKLTYNGVAQSDTATKYGQYTFWTKEQAYYKDTLAPAKAALVEVIAGDVASTYAPAAAGILMSDMQCDRGVEGDVVYLF